MRRKRVTFYRKSHEAAQFGFKIPPDVLIMGYKARKVFINEGEGLSKQAIEHLEKWINNPYPGTLILVKELKHLGMEETS